MTMFHELKSFQRVSVTLAQRAQSCFSVSECKNLHSMLQRRTRAALRVDSSSGARRIPTAEQAVDLAHVSLLVSCSPHVAQHVQTALESPVWSGASSAGAQRRHCCSSTRLVWDSMLESIVVALADSLFLCSASSQTMRRCRPAHTKCALGLHSSRGCDAAASRCKRRSL